MSLSQYPSTLPQPAVLGYQPLASVRGSAEGGLYKAESFTPDISIEITAEVFCDPTQASTFFTWWRDTIYRGGATFSVGWRVPALGVAKVAKFTSEPTFNHVGNGAYRISFTAVVRGVSSVTYLPPLQGFQWATATGAQTGRANNSPVIYGNGVFAFGYAQGGTGFSTVAYSLDGGATWGHTVIGNYGGYTPRLAYSGGVFLADILGSNIAISNDGVNWVQKSIPSLATTASRPWGANNRFFRVASTSISFNVGAIQEISLQGTADAYRAITDVPFDRNYTSGFYALGVNTAWASGGPSYSVDGGYRWFIAPNQGWHWPAAMHYGKLGFVSVGVNATNPYTGIVYSGDGKSWKVFHTFSKIWAGYAYFRGAHYLFSNNANGITPAPYIYTSTQLTTGWAPATVHNTYAGARAAGYHCYAFDPVNGRVVGMGFNYDAIGYGVIGS